jgi:N-acetyl-anhydromuramyl-L-alanine amidase AmpD
VDPKFFNGNIYEDYMVAFGYRFWEDYPPAQIESLKVLVQDIRARWNIPWDMVMGHYRINKKDDPGPALNLFWPRYGYPSRPPIFDITQP